MRRRQGEEGRYPDDVLFAGRPQLRGAALATALKLHVNVEGGFGPTWALQHASTVEAILAAVDKLDDTALKGFARCLAGEDALPVSRASRAYPALKPVFDHALSCCPALSLQAACSPTAHRKKKKSKNKETKTSLIHGLHMLRNGIKPTTIVQPVAVAVTIKRLLRIIVIMTKLLTMEAFQLKTKFNLKYPLTPPLLEKAVQIYPKDREKPSDSQVQR